MSKHIASIPLADIERIAIVTGNGRSMAQVKGDADYICNAGFYDMTTGRPVGHLKADGAVLAKEVWGCWGFAWDKYDIKMSALPDAKRTNYISGVEMLSPMIGIHDAMHYRPEVGGSRPRTAMALTGDKLLLYCADSPSTPEALRDTLYKLGAETALMLDGGGSSQCDFAGQKISSSRRVHNYLAVWLRKKEDKPVDGITQAIMTNSDCYKAGRTITPKGIMVHSTATPGANANAIRDAWDRAGAEAAVHYIIDDQRVFQTLPDTCRAWHAGGAANSTHISFEICEPQECRLLPAEWTPLKQGSTGWAVKRLQMELTARGYDPKGIDGSFGPGCTAALKACQKDLGLAVDGSCGPATLTKLASRQGSYLAYNPQDTAEYFEAVWDRAVALCVRLCRAYGLTADSILCHSEGYVKGIASNHADVMHWWPYHGKTMDMFRAAVGEALGGKSELYAAVDKLAGAGIITNPAYWKGGAYSAANVQALIIKMAAAL